MMVRKYRKKPVVINAIQYNGENWGECRMFLGCYYGGVLNGGRLSVITRDGVTIASINDYIIKGVNGEFYVRKPDIFEMSHEAIRIKANEDK